MAVAIARELGITPPPLAVAFLAALVPAVPCLFKADTIVEGGLTPNAAYVVTTAGQPRHLAT